MIRSAILVSCGLLSGVAGSPALEAPRDLVEALASETYSERVNAEAGLLEWALERPRDSASGVYRAFRSTEDPEVRLRCLAVLRELAMKDYLREGEGYVGVRIQAQGFMNPNDEDRRFAILITGITEGTPAQRVGLRAGDLVVGVDDLVFQGFPDTAAFSNYIRARAPGTSVTLHLQRAGEELEVELELGRMPADLDFQMNRNPQRAAELDRLARQAHFREWLDTLGAELEPQAVVPPVADQGEVAEEPAAAPEGEPAAEPEAEGEPDEDVPPPPADLPAVGEDPAPRAF